MKIGKYLLEVVVIFVSVMMAFIAEDWRENRQDMEDFSLIMDEIENDIRLDSIEMYSDKRRINDQINCLDQLLNDGSLITIDSISCLELIMFIDWPDYVLTGFDQLKNSKIISSGKNAQLMNEIYEYYQWVDYHIFLLSTSVSEVHELKEYFINRGFPPVDHEPFTKSDVNSFQKLQIDTELITRIKYLKYNRRMELRIYEMMGRKNKVILDLFNNSN